MMTNSDLLNAQFNLGSDACIFLNTQQMVTKINKSAALMFNTSAEKGVGLQISEFLTSANCHFLDAMSKLTTRDSGDEAELKE